MPVSISSQPAPLTARVPFYYGWIIVVIAASAMVATLPGRTQGLGLVTEPLLRDLQLDRVQYGQINLWATLIGSLFCLGFGKLIDLFGGRLVLVTLLAGLGVTVGIMSRVTTVPALIVCLILTRGLGQSALSAASISLVGLWFQRRLPKAMAVYSVLLSIGFMAAFPITGGIVEKSGWRSAWLGLGIGVMVLVPLAAVLVQRPPRDSETVAELDAASDTGSFTLGAALRTPAFWVVGLASAVYLLVASGIGLFNESILGELGFPATVYHTTLAVGAVTALVGNFAGGWLVGRHSPKALLAVAMCLLSGGLLALPHLRSLSAVMMQAVVMGLAGGFITVLFFTFWRRFYGREHLGQIQGAAQMLTVIASALGPLVLAQCHFVTGSYAFIFRLLAVVTLLLAIAAAVIPLPRR